MKTTDIMERLDWIELTYQCPICGMWFVSMDVAKVIGRECCRKTKHIDILV
jgi:hypothetical protein